MQKLGILDLSRNLKPPTKPKTKPIRPRKPSPSASSSPRRSFRLKTMPTVSYAKKRTIKAKLIMFVKPEVYTEDHEKMLGDHIETWKLLVDGHVVRGILVIMHMRESAAINAGGKLQVFIQNAASVRLPKGCSVPVACSKG
ncbi:hypothetical protein L1987_02092 [Smallanthus sonchifolius]|uniref:Uncharacterized protein n=1 Tax=Smallanthus sonchifolius TaxID=185202 RepID=A0ACB9K6U3_9ASTR|nr:hypothetical protein L1987_02092 [Smallanthus sonchifolius]